MDLGPNEQKVTIPKFYIGTIVSYWDPNKNEEIFVLIDSPRYD